MAVRRGDHWFANYLPGLIERGISQRQAMRELRDAGLAFRDATFRRAWGETQRAMAQADRLRGVNVNRRPAADEFSQWTTRRRTGYVYQFNVLGRIRGTDVVYQTVRSVRYDRPVSYRKATEDVLTSFREGAEQSEPNEMTVGAIIENVYELVPEE